MYSLGIKKFKTSADNSTAPPKPGIGSTPCEVIKFLTWIIQGIKIIKKDAIELIMYINFVFIKSKSFFLSLIKNKTTKKMIESKTDKKYWKFDKRVKAITKPIKTESISFFLNSFAPKNLNIINNVKGNK